MTTMPPIDADDFHSMDGSRVYVRVMPDMDSGIPYVLPATPVGGYGVAGYGVGGYGV